MSLVAEMTYEPWPEFSYPEFAPTAHLFHMVLQAIGKLKLNNPFEPHWANVCLWLTCRGLTTGQIFHELGAFGIDIDLIDHQIICSSTWGRTGKFKLTSMSVAELTQTLFKTLHNIGVTVDINPTPQEVPNAIPFDQDTKKHPYEGLLINAWWRILVSSYRVLKQYHSKFTGITPPVGLMWGTLDLRDARYRGTQIPTSGINSGYIRRNAMDDAQVEAGWWSGNPEYQKPAYFSFTYPQPTGIEEVKIQPPAAKWNKKLGEFILDYDDVRKSKNPEKDLLAFFESTYKAGAEKAGWEPDLIGAGKPV